MTTFELTQQRVLDLKSRLNPGTGQPYSLAEIARLLGFRSAQALHYYTRDLAGRCPGCLRTLKGANPYRGNRPTVDLSGGHGTAPKLVRLDKPLLPPSKPKQSSS